MGNTVEVSGEQFIDRGAPLMLRLICLPGEQRKGAMAALLGGIETRLESFQYREEFLALFQWTVDDAEHEASRQDAKTLRAG
jgi:hypothetical protein